MLSINQNDPKVVTIRVFRAEDLKFHSEFKKKKLTTKWRVVFISGSKKRCSEIVSAPNGDPKWDCEVNLKVSSRQEPISLLVMDSEEHHVGQVILPLTQIRPLPADHDPWATHKIIASCLEPTKKNSYPSGTLYFWAYVAEYCLDGETSGGGGSRKISALGGSMQSLSILSKSKSDLKSLFRKSDKSDASAAIGEDQNSIISSGKKSRGRFWSKKKGGAGSGAMSKSMCDLSGGMMVTSDIRLDGGDSSSDGEGCADSSILGGSSGIGSEGPGSHYYNHFDSESASAGGTGCYDSPLRSGGVGSWGKGGLPPPHSGAGGGCYGSSRSQPQYKRSSVSSNTFVKNSNHQKRISSGMIVKEIDLENGGLSVQGNNGAHRSSSFQSNGGGSSKLSKTDSGVGTMGRRKSSLMDLFAQDGKGSSKQHRREPSEGGGSESGTSDWIHGGGEKSKSMWSLNKPKRGSANKKDLAELYEMLRQENDTLVNRLMEANRTESGLRDQCTTLRSQLTSRERDVERLSRSLCDLRNRLLTDGFTIYLEKAI